MKRMSLYRVLETTFSICGTALLLVFIGIQFGESKAHGRALAAFNAAVEPVSSVEGRVGAGDPVTVSTLSFLDNFIFTPDQSLWSGKRKRAYDQSLSGDPGTPYAVLKIPARNLIVPIFAGDSKLQLSRGAGHVSGTSLPGESGNSAIAAHRDGYFRGLKDLPVGSMIELETMAGHQSYRIAEITIVKPTNVDILEPTTRTTITLITCYPFYFIGHAPERYIVRAVLETSKPRRLKGD